MVNSLFLADHFKFSKSNVKKRKRREETMGLDQWVTIAIILVIALAAGLLIHAVAPGALSTWFNGFLSNVLSKVPTS